MSGWNYGNTQCGEYTMVGGYGVTGSTAEIKKTFDIFSGAPNCHVNVEVDIMKIDSWDDEVYICFYCRILNVFSVYF